MFENYVKHIFCVCFSDESPRSLIVPFQRWDPYCLQMNVLGLHSFSITGLTVLSRIGFKNWLV